MTAPDDTDASEGRPDSSENVSGRPGGERSGWAEAMREMGPYLDLGWRLAATTAGMPLLGHFCVDFWFGTTPWGLLSGAVLGLAAAGVQLKQLQRELKG